MQGLCPACGGALAPWRDDLPGGDPGDPARYALARCERCGSAVTLGAPPQPERYASGIYGPEPPRARRLVAAAQRLVDRQAIALLRSAGLRRGARVLDAGAGRGRLVQAIGRAGFVASGIDPSGRAGRGAGAVQQASIEGYAERDLDAVVLWHVVEHLDEPHAALQRAADWLRPGGTALVAVPNIASWQARIAGPAWLHLDLPRHRTHFTPAGLELLLRRAGLRPQRWSHMVWEHNPSAMWMALASRAHLGPPGLAFHLLKRTRPGSAGNLAATVAALPLAPIALALEALAAGARRGGTLAVVATRS